MAKDLQRKFTPLNDAELRQILGCIGEDLTSSEKEHALFLLSILPPHEQWVLYWALVEGDTHRSIAKLMGSSQSVISGWINARPPNILYVARLPFLKEPEFRKYFPEWSEKQLLALVRMVVFHEGQHEAAKKAGHTQGWARPLLQKALEEAPPDSDVHVVLESIIQDPLRWTLRRKDLEESENRFEDRSYGSVWENVEEISRLLEGLSSTTPEEILLAINLVSSHIRLKDLEGVLTSLEWKTQNTATGKRWFPKGKRRKFRSKIETWRDETRVLHFLKKMQVFQSFSQIAVACDLSPAQAQTTMDKLISEKKVFSIGTHKSRRYLLEDGVLEEDPEITDLLNEEFPDDPEITEVLEEDFPEESKNTDGYTERQKDVLRLIANGINNREIGETLNLSINTVKSHVGLLLKKLNVKTRDEAVMTARMKNIL